MVYLSSAAKSMFAITKGVFTINMSVFVSFYTEEYDRYELGGKIILLSASPK